MPVQCFDAMGGMLAKISRSRSRAASPAALGIIGLAFMFFGVGLLGLAFSSATFSRLVTYAWVAGVAGLVFLISGMVAAAYGFLRARKNHSGIKTRKAPTA